MTALTGTCPVHSFDPFASGFLADPYPTLTEMRESGPVRFSPVLDMWVVTRYDDIQATNDANYDKSGENLQEVPRDTSNGG